MTRYLTLLTFLLMSFSLLGQTGAISGQVTDLTTKEGLAFANVAVYQSGNLITGVSTDIDGYYNIGNLDPGTYEVEVSYVGYGTKKVEGVGLRGGQTQKVNVELSDSVDVGVEVTVVAFKVPLITQGITTGGVALTKEDITNRGSANITTLTSKAAGVSQTDENQAISSQGARTNSNVTFIDGVRVIGNFGISERELEQVEVITGGLPAAYSALGAVTNLITKTPTANYEGYAEAFTSKFLDAYETTSGRIGFSGPLLSKALKDDNGEVIVDKNGKVKKKSIIGFRLSGVLNTSRDATPSALGSFKLKDEKLAELMENPILVNPVTGVFRDAANSITEDDVEITKIRPNNSQFEYFGDAKLFFRINEDMEFRLSGQYTNSRNRASIGSYRLLNSTRNPVVLSEDFRVKGLFRHRISGTNPSDDDDDKKTGSFLQNVSYSLQFDFSQTNQFIQDDIHKSNFFDYGYVGKFVESRTPQFAPDSLGIPVHFGFSEVLDTIDFSGSPNPGLVLYNQYVEDANEKNDYIARNGIVYNESENLLGSSVSGLHANIYSVYDNYRRDQENQYGVLATGNFDLARPGGENKVRHSLQFGIEYQQRVVRQYRLRPVRLWQLAEQLANSQITNAVDSVFSGETVVENGVTVPLFLPGVNPQDQSAFDVNLRAALGKGEREWINVDGLSPEDLKLEYFEPTSLVSGQNRVLGYFGYDYLGNPVGTDVSFEDFFTQKDENGYFTRPVAPNQPIYSAVYVQDRFQYKDVFMTLGLRVDRYDANTKVLKDPYTLYGAFTAGEIEASEYDFAIPSTIEDDFAVYVNDPTQRGAANVLGFRKGDQWYSASGETVNLPSALGDNLVPARRDYKTDRNLKQPEYDFESVFEDFTPSVVVMPRIAFSFPISDEAEFFAHYDVIAQRPPGNATATALNYFNFTERVGEGRIFGNPNLKLESLIDYQVGYQQKLSAKSKLEVSLFYKEMKNLIQAKTYIGAYPIQYESFANDDFSTSKGVTLEYEMRRTNNLRVIANYTLQFADGTGSNPVSNRGLLTKDINYLFPLDFDQRHAVFLYLDYRYGAGKDYNGPKLFGTDILSNTGAALDFNLLSGQPFTKKAEPTIVTNSAGRDVEGRINGARKPWIFRVDFKIDKSFKLVKDADKRQLNLNVYFRVQNLLNTRNVINVYPYTGSALDDGYLTLAGGQGQVLQAGRTVEDAANYLLLYDLIRNNPGNISIPRRVYLGALFEF